ncbi:MAG: GNAT family N-acetyltransferase [Chitinophagaceae bacterium]
MPSATSILQHATPDQLEQAAAQNHTALFFGEAIAHHGEVIEQKGISWTCAGEEPHGMVAFPTLTEDRVGPVLDGMMDYFREHKLRSSGCWSLSPAQPSSLGARLLARGFQPGWRPCWMSLDLHEMNADHPAPAALKVYKSSIDLSDKRGLPNAGPHSALSWQHLQHDPEHAHQFVAELDGQIVAHAAIFLTTGEYGVAGVYNVGVLPFLQGRGIGKAVVAAACTYARQQGYRYAVLNGTGQRMYEQLGFTFISYGLTWWLSNRFVTHAPAVREVAIAEAVALGNTTALETFRGFLTTDTINDPICNRMTLVQLAVHCKQPVACEWLIQHGAAFSVLDAWDIGWPERAAALLAARPELVNEKYGEWECTLLHTAAERDDIALAELALSAGPDLSITDKIYHNTALGWAQHLERAAIVAMIEKHKG